MYHVVVIRAATKADLPFLVHPHTLRDQSVAVFPLSTVLTRLGIAHKSSSDK